MKNVILASASPRRIEIMKNNGFNPYVFPAHVDETLPFKMTPESTVMYLAFKKASWVAENTKGNDMNDVSIIAADTVVVFQNKIIGKPKGKQDAFLTLSKLRNNCHQVITGVCILHHSYKTCFYETTNVFFKNYSDEELMSYVNTTEPYDKAGGYAIQGTFGKYVDHINGDYDNVVGFPWKKIYPYLNHRHCRKSPSQ